MNKFPCSVIISANVSSSYNIAYLTFFAKVENNSYVLTIICTNTHDYHAKQGGGSGAGEGSDAGSGSGSILNLVGPLLGSSSAVSGK